MQNAISLENKKGSLSVESPLQFSVGSRSSVTKKDWIVCGKKEEEEEEEQLSPGGKGGKERKDRGGFGEGRIQQIKRWIFSRSSDTLGQIYYIK